MFGVNFEYDIKKYNLFEDIGIPKEIILNFKEKGNKIFEYVINTNLIYKKNKNITPDKDNCYFNFIITPFIFKIEKIIYLLVQVQDFTEKKLRENLLIENNQIFKSVVEESRSGIFVVNNNYKIIYANKKSSEILGEPLEKLIDKDFRKFVSKRNREKMSNLYRQQQKGMIIPTNYEFSLTNKKGETRYVELNVEVIKISNNPKTIVKFIDKTDQIKAEKELRESEIKIKKIFEIIPDLFFLVKKDSTILNYKGDLDNLYLSPQEFLNNKLSELLPEDIANRILISIKNALETKEQQILEYQLPFNDEIRFYEARILYFKKNETVIFVRDITDRKKTDSILQEEYKRLKEIDNIRKNLISSVSHELKTPIMAISNASEFLLDVFGEKLGPEPLELLKIINSNERRLERLINDLLDISRTSYSKIQLDKEQCNISNLIQNISNEMEYLIKERKLSLNLDLLNMVYINIDIVRIEQVIINLLTNAIKNTPPGGNIHITMKKINDYLEIRFIDTGIGLTKDEINRLFTQFGRLERYGEGLEYLDIKGSGLGLYISKEIIKMHNGEIQAKSKGRNMGSSFIIRIPFE